MLLYPSIGEAFCTGDASATDAVPDGVTNTDCAILSAKCFNNQNKLFAIEAVESTVRLRAGLPRLAVISS